MNRLDRLVRGLIPSVASLSRSRLLMSPLDAVDRILSAPYPEARALPPNHMRVRVGVGNQILFNHGQHLLKPVGFWLRLFSQGRAGLDHDILDIGSGCGRYAWPLHDLEYTGMYTGIDVDQEMVDWCKRHFNPEHFDFRWVDAHSRVYNPEGRDGGFATIPVPTESKDLVIGMSLLTHLLERDLIAYLAESHRVLRSGGHLEMTVFCMEDMVAAGMGGRWTFRHRVGNAFVENLRWPEAAVGYTTAYLVNHCRDLGFSSVQLSSAFPGPQSVLHAEK